MKRGLAALLALLQLAWSSSFGSYQALAQIVVSQPVLNAPVVQAVPMPGRTQLPSAGLNGGLTLTTLSPLSTLPTALPAPAQAAKLSELPALQAFQAQAAPKTVAQEAASLPARQASRLETPVQPAADKAPRTLQAVSEQVTKSLEQPGLRKDAPADSSRGAAEQMFTALTSERLIAAPEASFGGTAVEAALSPALRKAALSASQASARESRQEPPSPTESDQEILQDLSKNAPAAVFFDYDLTLTENGPNGLSKLPSEGTVRALSALLKAGVPVGLVTARSFDREVEGAAVPDSVFEPLIGRIPEALRPGLFFAGQVGGEVVLFDAKGQPVRVQEGGWSSIEKTILEASIRDSLRDLQVAEEEVAVSNTPSKTYIRFKDGDPRAALFADALSEAFRSRGLRAEVRQTNGWVFFSKYDKEYGIRQLVTAMQAKGYKLSEDNLLIVADDFKLRRGSDAAMAFAFPKARAVSVGDAGSALPPNVRRLSVKNAEGSVRVIEAVLKGFKGPSPLKTLWAKPGVRLAASFLAGAASVAAFPWLAANVAAVAAAGSITLSVIGIPQILHLHKTKSEGVKDLAVGSTLIWFAAAVLLSAVSIGNGSSIWWNAANVAGVAESAAVLGQINYYKRDAKDLKATALTVAASLAPLPFMALQLFMPLSVWVTAAFWAAMGLLWVLNWPQIRQNYRIYQAEGRAPKGTSPLYPALVALGSLLHLYAAVMGGDVRWMMNAGIAILTAGIVLAQIFFPGAANAVVAPLIKLSEKLTSSTAR